MGPFWIWLPAAVVGVPAFCVFLYFILRWIQRPGDAEPAPDLPGWVLRFNPRLRVAMIGAALGFAFISTLALRATFFAEPAGGEEGSAEDCLCPLLGFFVSGCFFLLSVYLSAEACLHRVVLSEEGLTVHRAFGRRLTWKWDEIDTVTYSPRLDLYRVRAKTGGTCRVACGLNGMDRFHACLDYYLWPGEPSAVPAYGKALKHPNAYVRRGAAVGLSRVGPAAGPAVPALTEALRDPNAGVRSWAAAALGEIGPEARASLPALLLALRDRDPDVRVAAAAGVWRVDRQAESALPVLLQALRDRDRGVRVSALNVLGLLGPDARPAVGSVLEALKDQDPDVRRAGTEALTRIDPDSAKRFVGS